ncbi:phasin family protein [uncultured Cohaesibacter sp.]|uniref:phasin family protein n=1 Tax=uncultured Cohaesibacter sp. TaxID=1002546 RepID=UPI0029C89C41|nr:phasin family protein [uncultured Cohaesibacter sp.]
MAMSERLFDVPSEFREMAEKGIKQTLKSYETLHGFAEQTADRFAGPAEGLRGELIDFNKTAISAADEGVRASFALAADLTRAESLQDVIALQTRYVQSQMQRFSAVAGELGAMAGRMTEGPAKASEEE